jgi:hypothetical protein
MIFMLNSKPFTTKLKLNLEENLMLLDRLLISSRMLNSALILRESLTEEKNFELNNFV